MAAATGCVPKASFSCLLPLWKTLSVIRFHQAPFKLVLLPRVPEHIRYCVHCLRWSLYFPQPPGSPGSKSHWPSKPGILGAVFPAWALQSEDPSTGWSPSLPGEKRCDCRDSLGGVTHLGVLVLTTLWF